MATRSETRCETNKCKYDKCLASDTYLLIIGSGNSKLNDTKRKTRNPNKRKHVEKANGRLSPQTQQK